MVSIKQSTFFLLLIIIFISISGCANEKSFSNQDSAYTSCKDYHKQSIISQLAPDGLEMFDDNPYNDPKWVEPTISFDGHSEETEKELIILLNADVGGKSNYECSCVYKKVEGLFWDKYQHLNSDGEFVSTTEAN